MTQTAAPATRNIAAVSGTLVHKVKMVTRYGATVPAPACRTMRQLERQIMTGVETDAPITCTNPKCRA